MDGQKPRWFMSNGPFSPAIPWLDERWTRIHRQDKKVALSEISIACMELMASAFRNEFRDGFSLLDYGCGRGRFANFLSEEIASFKYYGIDTRICLKKNFPIHETLASACGCKFGILGSDIQDEAIRVADHALLLSIWTHLPHRSIFNTLSLLSPILQRGGVIVAALFHAEESHTKNAKAFPEGDFYEQVYYSLQDMKRELKEFSKEFFPVDIELVGKWPDQFHLHFIYRISKAKE